MSEGHESIQVAELCEWAAALPAEQLPPREGDAARYFGRTTRTIGRWLERAGIEGWDGFLRHWSLEMRRRNGTDDSADVMSPDMD